MGVLVTLSGLAVALYAVMSALGLWLAGRVRRLVREGRQDDALFGQLPRHQIEMLGSYGAGWRGRLWEVSIIALIACVLAVMAGAAAEAAAAWFLAVALLADCLLFFTFPGRRAYVARMSEAERLADSAQCLVLLGAFGVLVWRFLNDM